MTGKAKNKALDPSDPFYKAQVEWDKTPEKERKEFYERNSGIIDRWQAETDAMADTDEEDTEKGAK